MIDVYEAQVNAFLEHHGVKGQKWGIRNTINKFGRGARKTGSFIKEHKKGVAIGVGASILSLLAIHGGKKVHEINRLNRRRAAFERLANEVLRNRGAYKRRFVNGRWTWVLK